MFSKFKILRLSTDSFPRPDYYKEKGQDLLTDYRCRLSETLDRYLKPNGHIDADQLSGEWFPAVDADIFISHSHADEDLALILAGWLKEAFGLTSFIDSTVWGNIADLQREIDQPLIQSNGTYNYHKRNQSTAYVHQLLSTALTKMMDNCEALFFLSTDNSLKSIENNITESVWIYHEIFTSQLLRKKLPARMNVLQKCFSGGVLESKVADGYRMDFKLNLTDFLTLTPRKINSWQETTPDDIRGSESLDYLYQLFNRPNDGRRIFG